MRLPGLDDRRRDARAAGFAVTTAAYDAFLDRSGIGAEIRTRLAGLDPADVRSVDEASTAIQELSAPPRCPPTCGPTCRRPSSSCRPPSPSPSRWPYGPRRPRRTCRAPASPGQQDTYLWLHGFDAVGQHIRSCWGSLYTSRAILYRLRNGIADDGLSMAVAVQKMVNARAAGVAITLNPTTGDRSKITHRRSWGVGEMVVSGQVTPDNLLVDKVMLSIVSEDRRRQARRAGPGHRRPPAGRAGRRPDRRAHAGASRRRGPRRRGDGQAGRAALPLPAGRRVGPWTRTSSAGQDLLLLQSRPETVHSNAAPTRPAPAAPAAAPTAINSRRSPPVHHQECVMTVTEPPPPRPPSHAPPRR